MAKDNLLIIGSTGWIGTYITDQILKSKDLFGRIAIFTSLGTAETKAQLFEGFKEQGVEVIVGDILKLGDLERAFEGIDVVISAVGRNIIAEQISWIPLLTRSPNIKRFFPSEYGTDIEYGPSSVHEKPHQQKLKVRAALAKSEGFEYTYVVTGPFAYGFLARMEKLPEIGSFDVAKKKATVLGDGRGQVSLTTEPDVGKLVVKALQHPEATKNRALKVNSFTTTPLEIVAEFEKQTGGEKWSVDYVPLEKLRELEEKAWETGNGTGFTLRRIWAEGGTLYEKRDNGLIDGEETDSLEDAVRVAIAKQTGHEKL
ncbi:NAD(P)-binding protein [Mollisia scopiformis]|uniref:NAD(P)-binding protein n=1 Tax=Mollisia scopiformis TaxID=149040 RepID=A0A132B560_MOLSC|nr:NAD(P)-binding protein [Mollisia scopiformis]KUJ07545.1 NAD(P)-binding protein [Mollisia scopiformis]